MRYLWHLNRQVPHRQRAGLVEFLACRFNDGSKVLPTEQQWQQHQHLYAASDAWVKLNVFPDDESLWEAKQYAFIGTAIDLADPALIDPQELAAIADLSRRGQLPPPGAGDQSLG